MVKDEKKVLKFPSKENNDETNAKKENVDIKIKIKKADDKQVIVIDPEKLNEVIMRDAPDFFISNLLIQSRNIPLTDREYPQDEEDYEKFEKLWDLQAKALIHTLSYIPVDVLDKFLKYIKDFADYYEQYDVKGEYPTDKEHEYYKFFFGCKDAANKLKEEKNKES